MENKGEGGWLSRIFKREKTPEVQTAPLIKEQPPQAKPVEEPPLISGEEIREQKMKERNNQLQQGGYATNLENSQNTLVKKKSLSNEPIPTKSAPERFRDLTKNPPKPTVPSIYTPSRYQQHQRNQL